MRGILKDECEYETLEDKYGIPENEYRTLQEDSDELYESPQSKYMTQEDEYETLKEEEKYANPEERQKDKYGTLEENLEDEYDSPSKDSIIKTMFD